jgi:hypothetical protein
MKKATLLLFIPLIILLLGGCQGMKQEVNIEAEKAAIKKVIETNIGWAVTKDTTALYSTVAHDDNLFWFSPSDAGNISGYKAFVDLTENFFMLDDFKAVGHEVKDLYIGLSQSGDAAWWHCRLDDFNEWKGKPANWEDVRWTGVLEKREGKWVIVQMHFSFATDAKKE